ncbi:Uncharacterised protein [Bordetella pseudohinzii]|uniref:Uncharacterized protein n=1 Tax=Bordetella pseudohinzii TaxID=1331258 RepID=A0A0M7I420_9BORD|nr:Uncharacterised protein [Bordetella pseudohinzii]
MRLRLTRFAAASARLVVAVAQQAQLHHQRGHQRGIELFPAAAAQRTGQHQITEPGADQPADRDAHGLEHAAHFAVAAFLQRDAVPAVAAIAPEIIEGTESGLAIIQVDALDQRLALRLVHLAQHAHGVFALGAVAGVHDAVGHIARGRENQQALGIQVQAAHRQPFAGAQLGQAGEHAGAAAGIIMADDFAGRLVIQDHARRLLGVGARDGLAIDADLVIGRHALPDMGRLAVDGHTARHDELFHLAPRTDARVGQHLVQLGHDGFAVQVLAQALFAARRLVQIGQGLIGLAFRLAGIVARTDGLGGRLIGGFAGILGFFARGVGAAAAKRRAQLAAAAAAAALAFGGGAGGLVGRRRLINGGIVVLHRCRCIGCHWDSSGFQTGSDLPGASPLLSWSWGRCGTSGTSGVAGCGGGTISGSG